MILQTATAPEPMTVQCPACDWYASMVDPLYPAHRADHLATLAVFAHAEVEHPGLVVDE